MGKVLNGNRFVRLYQDNTIDKYDMNEQNRDTLVSVWDDRTLGYVEKRMSEECSITGSDTMETYTSTCLEVCILN
jgi:hypothetical protein